MVEEYDDTPVRTGYTQEEQERQVARLVLPPRPVEVRDPFPVCPTVKLPQSDIDKMTERLYTNSIQQREANMAELDERTYKPITPQTKKMDDADVEESVKRLYEDAIARKQHNMDELRRKHLYHRPEPKKIPVKTLVQHMYDDRIEAKKKTEEKLYNKYIVPTEINLGRISRSRANAASDRLCTK